jgi:hypothetical protein
MRSTPQIWRRAGFFVDKILRGIILELPVEQAAKFDSHEPQDHKALGLTIPQSLLQRADQVVSKVSESCR